MEQLSLTVDNQGRIMLPAWWRKQARIGPSRELLVSVDASGALYIETREQGLARARALVRKYIPGERRLSDELISERREEAGRESQR